MSVILKRGDEAERKRSVFTSDYYGSSHSRSESRFFVLGGVGGMIEAKWEISICGMRACTAQCH